MKISLIKYTVCCFCILMIACHAHAGMTADEGMITGVRLAPDLNHLVIQHNGRIGSYATFVMGHPYRLVLDVRSTCLAKIPPKIKVDRAPIDEIRLGYANSRVRVVVDFGDNPVPPFQIERGAREIRLNMGKRLALGIERSSKSEKRKVTASSWARAASCTDSSPKATAAMRIKSARVDDNRVLLELADPQKPGKAYLVTVETNTREFKMRSATLRDPHGTVQRFDLGTGKNSVPGVKVETVEPADRREATGEDQTPSRDAKAKFTWGRHSGPHAAHAAAGPTKQEALRVERFVSQASPQSIDSAVK